MGENAPAQPYGATTFVAYGQYGSTVFDPPLSTGNVAATFLQLNICDQCLTRAGKRGRVRLVDRVKSVKYVYYSWKGGEEDGNQPD